MKAKDEEQVINTLKNFLASIGIRQKSSEQTRAKNIDVYRSTPKCYDDPRRREKFTNFLTSLMEQKELSPEDFRLNKSRSDRRTHSNIKSVNFNELAGKEVITFLPKMLIEQQGNSFQRRLASTNTKRTHMRGQKLLRMVKIKSSIFDQGTLKPNQNIRGTEDTDKILVRNCINYCSRIRPNLLPKIRKKPRDHPLFPKKINKEKKMLENSSLKATAYKKPHLHTPFPNDYDRGFSNSPGIKLSHKRSFASPKQDNCLVKKAPLLDRKNCKSELGHHKKDKSILRVQLTSNRQKRGKSIGFSDEPLKPKLFELTRSGLKESRSRF
ncbi:unnamed protein product [Moneuplotes crassus]|uniref:Uncharacterized protein n=2 Tax=Euplotes crassus TaxID=5936 RepID=A0AAD1XH26_EUPCR|nr:unnamed protein product [Moneuplotes crassus]